jgi:hypothetical protein
MLLQRFALYTTLGLVLVTMGMTAGDWQFWCVLALFWSSEFLTRQETKEQAMAEGIAAYLNMSIEDQNKIKKVHRDAMKDTDNG